MKRRAACCPPDWASPRALHRGEGRCDGRRPRCMAGHGPALGARGFTLIELLTAVMIVGILVSIAVASYQDYLIRAGRADAKAVLLETASFLERNYTANACYNKTTQADCAANPQTGADFPLPYGQSPKTGTARYTLGIAYVNSGQGYTLTATATGSQADDSCGNLTLTHTGATGVSGSGATVAECWQK